MFTQRTNKMQQENNLLEIINPKTPPPLTRKKRRRSSSIAGRQTSTSNNKTFVRSRTPLPTSFTARNESDNEEEGGKEMMRNNKKKMAMRQSGNDEDNDEVFIDSEEEVENVKKKRSLATMKPRLPKNARIRECYLQDMSSSDSDINMMADSSCWAKQANGKPGLMSCSSNLSSTFPSGSNQMQHSPPTLEIENDDHYGHNSAQNRNMAIKSNESKMLPKRIPLQFQPRPSPSRLVDNKFVQGKQMEKGNTKGSRQELIGMMDGNSKQQIEDQIKKQQFRQSTSKMAAQLEEMVEPTGAKSSLKNRRPSTSRLESLQQNLDKIIESNFAIRNIGERNGEHRAAEVTVSPQQNCQIGMLGKIAGNREMLEAGMENANNGKGIGEKQMHQNRPLAPFNPVPLMANNIPQSNIEPQNGGPQAEMQQQNSHRHQFLWPPPNLDPQIVNLQIAESLRQQQMGGISNPFNASFPQIYQHPAQMQSLGIGGPYFLPSFAPPIQMGIVGQQIRQIIKEEMQKVQLEIKTEMKAEMKKHMAEMEGKLKAEICEEMKEHMGGLFVAIREQIEQINSAEANSPTVSVAPPNPPPRDLALIPSTSNANQGNQQNEDYVEFLDFVDNFKWLPKMKKIGEPKKEPGTEEVHTIGDEEDEEMQEWNALRNSRANNGRGMGIIGQGGGDGNGGNAPAAPLALDRPRLLRGERRTPDRYCPVVKMPIRKRKKSITK